MHARCVNTKLTTLLLDSYESYSAFQKTLEKHPVERSAEIILSYWAQLTVSALFIDVYWFKPVAIRYILQEKFTEAQIHSVAKNCELSGWRSFSGSLGSIEINAIECFLPPKLKSSLCRNLTSIHHSIRKSVMELEVEK